MTVRYPGRRPLSDDCLAVRGRARSPGPAPRSSGAREVAEGQPGHEAVMTFLIGRGGPGVLALTAALALSGCGEERPSATESELLHGAGGVHSRFGPVLLRDVSIDEPDDGLYEPGDVVRLDAAEPGNTAPLRELLPVLLRSGTAAASPNGVLGDPRGATAAEGEELLAAMTGELRDRLGRWAPDVRGRLT